MPKDVKRYEATVISEFLHMPARVTKVRAMGGASQVAARPPENKLPQETK